MKTLERKEALHCSEAISDYFKNFSRVDEYMLEQKLEQIKHMPTALPGMGFEEDLFNDYTMSPEDMDFVIEEPDNKKFDKSFFVFVISILNIIKNEFSYMHTNL